MKWIETPHLPQLKVSLAAVSGLADWVIQDLREKGITVVPIPPCGDLAKPVCSHTDLLLQHIQREQVAVYQPEVGELLKQYGGSIIPPKFRLTAKYPGDILYDSCRVGGYLFGRFHQGSPGLEIGLQNCTKISVKQGYTKCSVAIVRQDAVITADIGLFRKFQQLGFDVLKIQSGWIQLPGYDTGFIGGCCGKIDENLLYVTGKLCSHPDGTLIRDFCEKHGVSVVEGSASQLYDIGGIIPLMEAGSLSQSSYCNSRGNSTNGRCAPHQ